MSMLATPDESLGPLLRRLRLRSKLTLEDLAQASGVSTRAISNMERGSSLGPQQRTIDLIADELSLDPFDRAALLTAARSGRRRMESPDRGLLALPRQVGDFAGRQREIDHLKAFTSALASDPHASVMVVCGQPGIGKTSLAVHFAALRTDEFPDGQFFVDLRGLDRDPPTPGAALERIIRVVAPEIQKLPRDLEVRAALFRGILLDRRVLLVLDNAADEAQVRPLLMSEGRSAVLITSRRRLTGLEGTRRLTLGPLQGEDAQSLLRSIAGNGEHIVSDDLKRISRLCAHLPLALRIAGNQLASRPGWSADHLANRLQAEGRRLNALSAGDLHIEATFELSYAQLSNPAKRLFRRLALVQGADTGVPLASVLLGKTLEDTEDLLDELVELGLLGSGYTGRFRFHDLLRLFAAGKLEEQESPAEKEDAIQRSTDWLLETTIIAGNWYRFGFGAPPADWHGLLDLSSEIRARNWLRTEADSWLPALRVAAGAGRHRLIIEVAHALVWYSSLWKDWNHWPEIFDLSVVAARAIGDRREEANQLNGRAWVSSACVGDYDAALWYSHQAYAIADSLGDPAVKGWSRMWGSVAYSGLFEHVESLAYAQGALDLFTGAKDTDGVPQALLRTGSCLEQLGRYEDALPIYQRYLDLVMDPIAAMASARAEVNQSLAQSSLARVHSKLGQWRKAADLLGTAVPLARKVGQHRALSKLLALQGEAGFALGDLQAGQLHLSEAIALSEQAGDPDLARKFANRLAALSAVTEPVDGSAHHGVSGQGKATGGGAAHSSSAGRTV